MKKLLALLLLSVTLITLCACSNESDVPDGMKNVAAENAPFSLYVPSTWIEQTESGVSGASFSNDDTSNVTVLAYQPGEVMTPAEYWEKVALPEYQNGVLKDLLILDNLCGDEVLGGLNAKKYVYSFTLGTKTYRQMQLITLKSDRIYIMTYTATAENFDKHLEEVESIRANFKFR